MSDDVKEELGAEHLDDEEKKEIVESRYDDAQIAHYVSMIFVFVGTPVFLYFTPSDKINAFTGIAYAIIIYSCVLSLNWLAKGIASKVVERFK